MGIPIEGYEDYLVYKDGKIFSNKTKKFLKINYTRNGYATVELFNNKNSKRLLVHRLVAQTFIDNPNNLPQVNHKDENKTNNCVDNLEWCNAKYNMNYGTAAQKRHLNINYNTQNRKEIARINGKSKAKKVAQIKENKIINIFENGAEASRKTKTNHSHLLECCNGKRKTANKYEWKFIERGEDLSEYQY